MNQYSKKRQKVNREYSKLAKAFKEAHPICMVQSKSCSGVATEIHHKKGRGEFLCDVSTFVAVCRNCHNMVELNPIWAKQAGFSQSRLTA